MVRDGTLILDGTNPSLWMEPNKGDGQWIRDGTLILDRTR